MNAELTIQAENRILTTTLTNVMVEEYPDGLMISADNFVYTVSCGEINAKESTEKENRYWLNDHSVIVLNWHD